MTEPNADNRDEPWCDEQYENPDWEPATSPWDTAVPDPETLPLFPEPDDEN